MNARAPVNVRQPERFPYKFLVMFSCFVASLMFVLFQGGKLALMVFVIVLVLNVYLVLGRWSGIRAVKGQRLLNTEQADEGIEAGSAVKVKLKVQVPGFWPVPYVLIRDRLVRKNGGEHEFDASLIPDWTRKGEVEYSTPPLIRGFYRFGETACSTKDVFGLFEHTGTLDLPVTFKVYPQTVRIKEWKQLQRLLKGANHHTVTTRATRETTQINGVREYSYGDRLSRIHWNATARTGTLKSKEFEKESLPKTIIFLDRQAKAYRNPEQFELAVSVAASLFQYAKNREISLGLLSVGADSAYYEPKSVQGGIKNMMHHLIEVGADGTHSMLRILEDRSRMFEPGVCMIIISPEKGEGILKTMAWLHQRQMVPCHILLTPHAEEGAEWCRQLRTMGHMGYAVRTLEELPAALRGVSNG